MKMTPLALLMDVDGTLTPPRQTLLPEMAEALKGLKIPFHVAAGSDMDLVSPQFLQPLYEFGYRKDFEAFVSNGATHFHCAFSKEFNPELRDEFDFKSHLGDEGYTRLVAAINQIQVDKKFQLAPGLKVIGDRFRDRRSMVNFAPIGRQVGSVSPEAYLNRQAFSKWDKETGYRKGILDFLNRVLADLIEQKQLYIMLGGETSFDIVIKGMDKTHAVRSLLEMGVEKVIFLGDALFPGGNDSVILGFHETWSGPGACPLEAMKVDGWEHTIQIFKDHQWLD